MSSTGQRAGCQGAAQHTCSVGKGQGRGCLRDRGWGGASLAVLQLSPWGAALG